MREGVHSVPEQRGDLPLRHAFVQQRSDPDRPVHDKELLLFMKIAVIDGEIFPAQAAVGLCHKHEARVIFGQKLFIAVRGIFGKNQNALPVVQNFDAF